MKTLFKRRMLLGVLGSVLFLCTLISSKGFSLLGPFTPWMTPDLGYYPNQADIGGPMALGEEYRWNVPVLTYGFDQSFIDYFGQPGIDAVEQAIQVINQLPSASQMVLTNYSQDPRGYNFQAMDQNLFDLKSSTLTLLLEQLGLTSPTRYIWTLTNWDSAVMRQWRNPNSFLEGLDELHLLQSEFIPYLCVKRNYDPFTTQESNYVNGTLFSFYVRVSDTNCTHGFINYYSIGATAQEDTTVADGYPSMYPGAFFKDLSQDDIGGMLYLLNRTNVHLETLEGSVFAASDSLIRTALRPGIDKITFLRHATNENGNFVAMTNRFQDIYVTNSAQMTQSVQRVTSTPDFIFSVKDCGFVLSTNYAGKPLAAFYQSNRTGTTNWVNNSKLNANSNGTGPGVIQGPVQIAFSAIGKYVAAAGSVTNEGTYLWNWGSFSGSGENIVHPGNQTNLTCLTLSTKLISSNGTPALEWLVLGHQNASYRIESSTNLVDWTATGSITNTDGIFVLHQPLDQPAKYFRTILEE